MCGTLEPLAKGLMILYYNQSINDRGVPTLLQNDDFISDDKIQESILYE